MVLREFVTPFLLIMIRYVLVSIGIILTLLNSLTDFFRENELFILSVAVFLIGVPHGAADFIVAKSIAINKMERFDSFGFIFFYLVKIAFILLLFYYFPILSLVLFLIYSGYHFGEIDNISLGNESLFKKVFILSSGLLTILFIFFSHRAELISFVSYVIINPSDKLVIYGLIDKVDIIFISVLSIYVFNLFLIVNKNKTKLKCIQISTVFHAINLVLIYLLPLMQSFLYYFVIWHSCLSFYSIFNFFKSHTKIRLSVIVRNIILFGSLANIMIVVIFMLFQNYFDEQMLLKIIIVSLAALTASHLGVISKLLNELLHNEKTKTSSFSDNGTIES